MTREDLKIKKPNLCWIKLIDNLHYGALRKDASNAWVNIKETTANQEYYLLNHAFNSLLCSPTPSVIHWLFIFSLHSALSQFTMDSSAECTWPRAFIYSLILFHFSCPWVFLHLPGPALLFGGLKNGSFQRQIRVFLETQNIIYSRSTGVWYTVPVKVWTSQAAYKGEW